MSSISSVLSTQNEAVNPSKSQKAKDDLIGSRDDFLTLLLAQLKNQDPLSPMKGTEFIDSITRLSTVEQAINQNQHLEKIEALLSRETNFGSPVSYLDKQIEFLSPAFRLENSEGKFFYNLEVSPDEVFLVIRDIDGRAIRSTSEGGNDIGENAIKWDGKDDLGNPVPDGEYFVSVDYVDDKGFLKTVPTSTVGIVTGANFEGNDIVLLVGKIRVSQDNVLSIRSNTAVSNES